MEKTLLTCILSLLEEDFVAFFALFQRLKQEYKEVSLLYLVVFQPFR